MNFVSAAFIVFFTITLALFFILPPRKRQPLLLAASYLFYATWSIPFIGVILLTTSLDYWISRYLGRAGHAGRRKLALAGGIALNLLVLGFFKYSNFLLANFKGIFYYLGWKVPLPDALLIILPLGISFYTFEAISYMVDVYRGKEPAPSWLSYNFYIMYFPHLISGPIIRFAEMWPQYREPLALPSLERFSKGVELVVAGFIYKVLIADQVAGLSDALFANPAEANALEAWVGTLAFTAQIYFDFMGYTHIARGASLFFNIELPLNFNHPYLANTISNFWERWHMSLSRWIRDYLYIPLGGSRVSLPHTMWNLLFTMLLAGAWHGAGWTFILWGGYHGVLLALYHAYKQLRKRWKALESWTSGQGWHVAAVAATFLLVVFGWVLFRAPDAPTAFAVFARLADLPELAARLGKDIATSHLTRPLTLLALLLACFAGPVVVGLKERYFDVLILPVKTAIVSAVLIICWIFTSQSSHPFIYFQF